MTSRTTSRPCWSALLLALAGGCLRTGSGTAVGNPGDADVQARVADPDLVLDAVEVPVDAWFGETCDGEVRVREVGRTLDGLEPSRVPVPVPAAVYCAQALALDGPIVVRGVTSVGTAFEVALAVDEVATDGRIAIDGDHLLFELPLALDAAALDALGEPEVALPPDDPLALGWAAQVRDGAALWTDDDGDGLLSAADRQVVPWDTGVDGVLAQQAEQGDCGCGGGGRGAVGGLLGILAVLVFRRR
jgi:hypothetical protein